MKTYLTLKESRTCTFSRHYCCFGYQNCEYGWNDFNQYQQVYGDLSSFVFSHGTVNWSNLSGKQFTRLSRHFEMFWAFVFLFCTFCLRKWVYDKSEFMYKNVHSSVIYNAPKLDKLLIQEITQSLLYIHMIGYREAVESDFFKICKRSL